LEVFSALALTPEDHAIHMSFDPRSGPAPRFQQVYVEQILASIIDNAKLEFSAIWKENQKNGVTKLAASKGLSIAINRVTDEMNNNLETMPEAERRRFMVHVLKRALPPVMIEHVGIETLMKRVPENYMKAIVSSWIASRYVYQCGMSSSEVSFFLFMQSLLSSQ